MGLFSSEYSYLGVNIGASSIKLVELANSKGIPHLLTYGFTEKSFDVIKDDSREAKKEMIALLRSLCKESGTITNKAVSALPTYSVFSSIISLPQMNKKDLPGAIRWEAKKIVPIPIEEISLEWYVLDSGSKKEGFGNKIKDIFKKSSSLENHNLSGDKSDIKEKIQENDKNKDIKVLLAGAPRNLVAKYAEIFQSAGLELLSLETEIFALIRSIIGNDPSSIMIVDLGAQSTGISIVNKGTPIINRSIDVGGKNITTAISQSMGVDFRRADQFKQDIGIFSGADSGNAIPGVIEETITPIIEEVKYSLELLKNQVNIGGRNIVSPQIEKIILTGGSSLIANLPDYLSKKLNIKVYIGDPWARVIYPEELRPVFQEIGSKMSIAVGLAMKEVE